MVDNCSTDKSEELALAFIRKQTDLNITLLKETKIGPSAARNRGIREASGEIVAFTDSDCLPAEDWLKKVAEPFLGSCIGAVAGRVLSLNTASVIEKFHSLFTMSGSDEPQLLSEFTLVKGGFPTANLAVRKDVLDSIQGFDEEMQIYSEDFDLCARIYKAGFKISYAPEAIVYHKHRNTLKGTWRQSYGFGTGHAVLLRKHFKNLVILSVPGFQYFSRSWPVRVWLDLKGADKKLIAIVLFFVMWWPVGLLIPLYLLHLFLRVEGFARRKELTVHFIEKWQMVFLLLFKSIALTVGRAIGSIQHRVFCI
jgi:GT2 family glycosyltransferase